MAVLAASGAPPFTAIFAGSLVLNVLATFRSSDLYKNRQRSTKASSDALTADESRAWNALLKRYLLVYLLATASDWLQGPYVYALYSDYGYSQHDIAVLFVAGFGSSMMFGSFVGGMADWGGRKRFVLVFCAIYAASCATKRESRRNAVPISSVLFVDPLTNHSILSQLYMTPTSPLSFVLDRLSQLPCTHAGSITRRHCHFAALFRL